MSGNSSSNKIGHNLNIVEALVDESSFIIKGFQEVVLSVRDIEKTSDFYKQVTGWEEVGRSTVDIEQLKIWGLPKSSSANEIILANPGVLSGFMRIISFNGVLQRPIRSSSQTWDTGGIYDIDLRAKNLDASFKELQRHGWSGFNDPLRYEFGRFDVSEVLMRGPDDVVLAIIERIKPPLEGFPHMKKLSHIFNSSQVVSDIEISKKFYIDVLGFKIYMEHYLKGSEQDQNLFGMPKNLYKDIERKICILHPEGSNAGSVELIQLDGAHGNDFASHAIPPNLGLLMLRFPVKNIDALQKHLIRQGVAIKQNTREVEVHPYGRCKCLAIQSPDGAWLEFLERIK